MEGDKEAAKSHKTHPALIPADTVTELDCSAASCPTPSPLPLSLSGSHTEEVGDKLSRAAVTHAGGGGRLGQEEEEEEGTICALLQGHVEGEKRDL